MVCMDVRSKLPNTNKYQGLMPPAAAPPRRLAARAVPPGTRAIPIAETLAITIECNAACNHNARMSPTQAHPALNNDWIQRLPAVGR